jgi:hypothetical protein
MEVLAWSCTRVEMDVDFTCFTHSACFLSISSISTAHLERSDWSVLRGLFQGNFRRISSVSTALFITLWLARSEPVFVLFLRRFRAFCLKTRELSVSTSRSSSAGSISTSSTLGGCVSRQLQAVDCDVDGGIVMREIAVGLCVARGLLSSLSRNSHIEVDNQAIIHSSFW